jgi:addiction module HigA family antidote
MLPTNRQPTHPGEILKELYMGPLGLTQTQLAQYLGIARNGLNEIINGKRSVSPEMAFKLGDAFGTGPEMWMNLQTNYDLYVAGKTHKPLKKIAG